MNTAHTPTKRRGPGRPKLYEDHKDVTVRMPGALYEWIKEQYPHATDARAVFLFIANTDEVAQSGVLE